MGKKGNISPEESSFDPSFGEKVRRRRGNSDGGNENNKSEIDISSALLELDSVPRDGEDEKKETPPNFECVILQLLESGPKVRAIIDGVIREISGEEDFGERVTEDVEPKNSRDRERGSIEGENFGVDQIQFYEQLAHRESVPHPEEFAKLVDEVGNLMHREEKRRKSAVVELPPDQEVVVISELNANREALADFLAGEPKEGTSETYLELLTQGKIHLVFTGNYTHRIGKEARRRQNLANKNMRPEDDNLLKKEILNNKFQNSIMSDALNSLQMLFSLKKRFPENITLLANRYELLLDALNHDRDTDLVGVNESDAYVEWLKAYFGPDKDVVHTDIGRLAFDRLSLPVMAIQKSTGVVIVPSVPSDFRTDRGKKVSSVDGILEGLKNANSRAVFAMCENIDKKIEMHKLGRMAAELGVSSGAHWFVANGDFIPKRESVEASAFSQSKHEDVKLFRLNNTPGVLNSIYRDASGKMWQDQAEVGSSLRMELPKSKL